jgi:hypothetical protein
MEKKMEKEKEKDETRRDESVLAFQCYPWLKQAEAFACCVQPCTHPRIPPALAVGRWNEG